MHGKFIQFVAIIASVMLFVLCIFLDVALAKMSGYNNDSQRLIEYWRHKTDSLLDENFKLYMQIYELEDSIITLRLER